MRQFMNRIDQQPGSSLEQARTELLQQVEDWLEIPMLVLGFGWLALLVVEFIWGLTPFLELTSLLIWGIFLLDFAIKFVLAPHKLAYLTRNWLTVIALAVPALRVFRAVRIVRLFTATRAARSVRLLRVLTTLNRGMKALRMSMGRRGLGYVSALTLVVMIGGAAGMYAVESTVPDGFTSFGEALWWTAMLMTTMGSAYWPQTAEGRILCLLLALYAFAVFGYVTASLASFFIGRDADNEEAEIASAQAIRELRDEIVSLREEIHRLHRSQPPEDDLHHLI
jgi:voltage-gated potassium channel